MSAAIEQRNQDATCYCGNLDEGASEELLWELMIQAGPVINVHMPRDKVTNTHQGYGFVEFRSEEDAEYAIKVLNMVKLFGKPLRVNKASQDRKAQDVGANLFIGQLDPEVDEKLLYDTFSAFGFITNTPKVMRDPDTGASKGYGFVSYDGFEASDLAIECMNGQHLCNRQIVVQYAYKKDSHGERHGGLSERLLAANNPLRFKPHTMFASEQGQLPDIQQLAAPALSSGQPLLPTSTIPMPSTSYLPLPPPPPPGTYVPSQIPQYLTMNQGGMYQMPPPTPPPPPPQFHGFNGMPVPPAPPTGGQFGLPYGMPPQPPFRPPSPTKSLAPPPMLSAPGAQKPIGVPPGMQFPPPPPPPSFMFPPPPPTLGSHPPSMPSQMEKSTGINGQNGLQDSSELDNISQMKMLSNFPNFLQNKEDTGEHHGIFTPVPPPHDMSMPVHNMPQNLLKGHEILPFQGQMDFSMPPPPPQTFQSDQNMDMEDSYMPSSPTRDIEFPQIQLTPNMFPSTGVNFPPGANPYIPNLAPPPPPTH